MSPAYVVPGSRACPCTGSPGRTRTCNLPLNRRLLCLRATGDRNWSRQQDSHLHRPEWRSGASLFGHGGVWSWRQELHSRLSGTGRGLCSLSYASDGSGSWIRTSIARSRAACPSSWTIPERIVRGGWIRTSTARAKAGRPSVRRRPVLGARTARPPRGTQGVFALRTGSFDARSSWSSSLRASRRREFETGSGPFRAAGPSALPGSARLAVGADRGNRTRLAGLEAQSLCRSARSAWRSCSCSAADRARTCARPLKRRLLSQLSYSGEGGIEIRSTSP